MQQNKPKKKLGQVLTQKKPEIQKQVPQKAVQKGPAKQKRTASKPVPQKAGPQRPASPRPGAQGLNSRRRTSPVKVTLEVPLMEGETLKSNLVQVLRRQKKAPLKLKELAQKAKEKQGPELVAAVEELVKAGEVLLQKGGYVLSRSLGLRPATVVKVLPAFGFARPDGEEEDVFLPGRAMKGAMPGDRVLISSRRSNGELTEAEVVRILQEGDYRFTGVVVKEEGKLSILPDRQVRFAIEIGRSSKIKVKEGDKVLANLCYRGDRHFSHKAAVLENFGDAQKASGCCEAILAANGIERQFPAEAIAQARQIEADGIHPKELAARLDLRGEDIFTIDGADTKDIDDAISLKKLGDGWLLGVHIADVSYYVTAGSPLDQEAFERGNSVYFPGSVVPMLPPELSNGICSLNPGEDRLAFSALVELGEDTSIRSYRFVKSVIRSQVKGVYSEINTLYDGTASPEIQEKYGELKDTLFLMKDLASRLAQDRTRRGALDLESVESKIKLDENGVAVDIQPRIQGISEGMIEEFMLVANQAAARFAGERGLPFVYRVHESPNPEKLQNLKETLDALGIPSKSIKAGVAQGELSRILRESRQTPFGKIVNNTLLRSMAKAKYSEKNIGHYGLVMADYAHFTSPIRRYSDLMIHRIMTASLTGMRKENIERRFREQVGTVALRTSEREVRAMQVERSCDDCYKAEYMKSHLEEEFDGVISSAVNHGVYVELPNTVEGLIRVADLGDYQYDGKMEFVDQHSGRKLRVGDPIRVTVAGVDVSAGQIDFVPADEGEGQ